MPAAVARASQRRVVHDSSDRARTGEGDHKSVDFIARQAYDRTRPPTGWSANGSGMEAAVVTARIRVAVDDPLVAKRLGLDAENILIESEPFFLDGPVSARVAVVDRDPTTGALAPSVRWILKKPRPADTNAPTTSPSASRSLPACSAWCFARCRSRARRGASAAACLVFRASIAGRAAGGCVGERLLRPIQP